MSRDALKLVFLRNDFYRDGYRRVLVALFFVLALNVALAGVIAYKWLNPPQPQYFPSTSDGRIIMLHDLSDPTVTDDFVLQWVTHSVQKAFSLDYVHWRDQLQDASSNFTPAGWRWFLNSLKSTNNLKTLVNLKLVSDAAITGAPQVIQKAVVGGHYAWKIKMPLLITYTGKGHDIRMPMNVTLIVIRMSVRDVPQRIAINNFIAETVKSNAFEKAVTGE